MLETLSHVGEEAIFGHVIILEHHHVGVHAEDARVGVIDDVVWRGVVVRHGMTVRRVVDPPERADHLQLGRMRGR